MTFYKVLYLKFRIFYTFSLRQLYVGHILKIKKFSLSYFVWFLEKSVFIVPCFVPTLYKPSPITFLASPLALSQLGIGIVKVFTMVIGVSCFKAFNCLSFIHFSIFCLCTTHAQYFTFEAFIVCTKCAHTTCTTWYLAMSVQVLK